MKALLLMKNIDLMHIFDLDFTKTGMAFFKYFSRTGSKKFSKLGTSPSIQRTYVDELSNISDFTSLLQNLLLSAISTVHKKLYCLTKISIRSSVNFPADFVCLWNPVPFKYLPVQNLSGP